VQARLPSPASEEHFPRFDTPNILWFFGALATASTSIGVVAAVHPSSRGIWIFLVALAFMAVYATLAVVLRAARWWVPGGLFAFVVVTLVPAIGVGFEKLVGVGPAAGGGGSSSSSSTTIVNGATTTVTSSGGSGFSGSIFALGLATIVAGLVVFALTRFEFVLALVAFATLITAELFLPAVDDRPSGSDLATTLVVTGTVLVLIGLLLDTRGDGKRRAAFWWHVFGLGGIAVGYLELIGSGNTAAGWAAMLATAAVVLAAAAPLGRATWAVYGLAGGYAPLVHYVAEGGGRWQIPLILVFVSLSVVLLGFVAHLYGDALGARFRKQLRI